MRHDRRSRPSAGKGKHGVATHEELTYLHMLSPADLRAAREPAVDVRLVEQDARSPEIRRLTLGIGTCHQWPSQQWTDEQWRRYLERPHLRHWAAVVDGSHAGMLSLDVPPTGEVEIDTFGLLPSYVGRGIGGHFLTLGVRLAWAVTGTSRIWLHTSSLDHPHALPNYEARGFRRYDPKKREAANP